LSAAVTSRCGRVSEPRSDERAKIGKQVAGSMNEHEREEIFCSRPDYAEHNSAHRQDDDRVGNGVDCTRMRAESFQFASMAKDKTGSVRQTKNEGHEHDAAYLGFEGGGQLRLNQRAKEKILRLIPPQAKAK
jgi:hypothetical protein